MFYSLIGMCTPSFLPNRRTNTFACARGYAFMRVFCIPWGESSHIPLPFRLFLLGVTMWEMVGVQCHAWVCGMWEFNNGIWWTDERYRPQTSQSITFEIPLDSKHPRSLQYHDFNDMCMYIYTQQMYIHQSSIPCSLNLAEHCCNFSYIHESSND